MKTWLWLGAVMGFMTALAVSGCRGGGASEGPDMFDVLALEAGLPPGDVAVQDSDSGPREATGSYEVIICDPPQWVALPPFCEGGDYVSEWQCAMEYYTGVCGLDEARRLLKEGLCPPPDRSVVREGERLILGGDPDKKTTLPRGAHCPEGFERLPQGFRPDPASWFQPTCWGVGYATRIPEPAVLDGKYILAGLDAFYLAYPGAGTVSALNVLNEVGIQRLWEYATPWPDPALGKYQPFGGYPPPTIEEGKMKVCAAKDAPWVDMDRREVVAQFGGFFVDVHIQNFQTDSDCVIPRLTVRSYCCGPILMLWPEEIAVLRSALVEQCKETRKRAEEEAKKWGTEHKEQWGLFVVAPRTKGLEWLGFDPERSPWTEGPNGPWTCSEAAACEVCVAMNSGCHGVSHDAYDDARSCLLSSPAYGETVAKIGSLNLELDENGYPVSVSKTYAHTCTHINPWCPRECQHETVGVPYRTPDEVAKDIPPP